MGKIKIIFMDVDYTLFDHNKKEFTPSGIEALKQARNNGVKVIICSSRPYSSLKYLGAIDNIPHDGYICVNGGIAYIENEYVLRYIVDEDIVKYVVETCNKHNILCQTVPATEVFQNREVNDYFLAFKSRWIQPTPRIKPYEGEKVTSMILFGETIVDELFHDLKNCYFFNFCPGGYDIYKKQYVKSEGINATLKYYGYRKEEAMAIGDDLNDIEMFKEVKYSIAMGNGKEEVKQKALYVTSNIDDNGVLNALKHYNVI